MSLDQLPNELIAHVGSFLDYKDNQQLGMVNRRIHAVLARDRLDKPKAYSLGFVKESTRIIGCYVQFTEIKREHFELDEDVVTNEMKVLNCINKFKTIEHLELSNIRLQDNAGWEDIDAKIRSVELEHCDIKMSKETLMKFFKKFDEVTIGDGCIMDPSYITDQFFVELARVGTAVHYVQYYNNPVVDVTDATLDALSSRRIPDKLYLDGLTTGITFARVKKMIEDALTTGMTEIRYNFGVLKSDQFDAVNIFMSEEFERWAEGFEQSIGFKHEDYIDFENYTIYNEDYSFFIDFFVYKPEELL